MHFRMHPTPNTLSAMPQVLIRIDAAGQGPRLMDDDEGLTSYDGPRWRYVATSDPGWRAMLCARRGSPGGGR